MTRLARLRDVFLNDREPERALFCTYGFDATFFESEVIPAIFPISLGLDRESGSQDEYLNAADNALLRRSISVFFNHVLGDGPELEYAARPVDVAPRDFHPKLMALDYGDVIRVVIGSANLTRAAWTGLLELFVVEDLIPGQPHPWSDGLQRFVSRLALKIPVAQRTSRAELAGNLASVPHAKGSSRVVSTWDGPLLGTLLEGVQKVSRIDAVTPFFEGTEGAGVFDALEKRLGPVKGRLYTASSNADGHPRIIGPADKLRRLVTSGGWSIYSVNEIWEGDEEGAPLRALHGKLLAVTHAGGVRLMIGSANITRAALLRQAPAANVELVVIEDGGPTDLKNALPQATSLDPDEVEFEETNGPDDEDGPVRHGAERFILEATYTAGARRLSLTTVPDAPELKVRYGDTELVGERVGTTWIATLELAVPRYVIVDDGRDPGVVPFVIIDPHLLVPRGHASAIGFDTFCEILAGGRESAMPAEGDLRQAADGHAGAATEPAVGARGAIPWRNYLAAVAGIGRELERERQVPRSLRFTIENPTRLAGLVERLHQAHDDRRFTAADLVYALYELEREVSRVLALDAPEQSRKLLARAGEHIRRKRNDLARAAGPRLKAQIKVLSAMDAR